MHHVTTLDPLRNYGHMSMWELLIWPKSPPACNRVTLSIRGSLVTTRQPPDPIFNAPFTRQKPDRAAPRRQPTAIKTEGSQRPAARPNRDRSPAHRRPRPSAASERWS
jgi:hypothetical protein